jgi:formylglycine-generating enzyme required for sulfatase activity
MTRISKQKRHAAPPPVPDRRRPRRWPYVALLALGLLGGAAVALLWRPAPPEDDVGIADAPPGEMVWVPGGTFRMGSPEARFPEGCGPACGVDGLLDSQPIHEVELSGFWLEKTPVTNAQFARFVRETGYKTVAERYVDGLPPLSFVFTPPGRVTSLRDHGQWWKPVPGADWRHPEGPGSDLKGREDHPVVHVCWDDAVAYAKWAGRRLPTEAEWELAARGGLDQKRYVWGDELKPGGKWMANIWQGRFPNENTEADGYRATSPVGAFPANGYGLYDMSGNVWQWCSDWYRPDYYKASPRRDPRGPADSFDPSEPGVEKRVQRGGSFLCSDMYCKGYMPGSRGRGQPNSAADHIGFRCAKDGP